MKRLKRSVSAGGSDPICKKSFGSCLHEGFRIKGCTASTPTEMLQQTNSEINSVTSSHDSVKSSTTFFLCAMDNDAGWTASLMTCGTSVQFKLDAGAQANTPRETHRRLSQRPALKKTQTKLLTDGSSSPLPVDGQYICQAAPEKGGARYLQFFVVAWRLSHYWD